MKSLSDHTTEPSHLRTAGVCLLEFLFKLSCYKTMDNLFYIYMMFNIL